MNNSLCEDIGNNILLNITIRKHRISLPGNEHIPHQCTFESMIFFLLFLSVGYVSLFPGGERCASSSTFLPFYIAKQLILKLPKVPLVKNRVSSHYRV